MSFGSGPASRCSPFRMFKHFQKAMKIDKNRDTAGNRRARTHTVEGVIVVTGKEFPFLVACYYTAIFQITLR